MELLYFYGRSNTRIFERINYIVYMRQNLKSGNNSAIETKEIREKLMVCFTNKGATSWQRK